MIVTKIISQNTYMHLNTSSKVYNACRKVVARWLHSDFMWLCTLEFKSFLSCLRDWICLAPCMRTYSILHLMLIHWDLTQARSNRPYTCKRQNNGEINMMMCRPAYTIQSEHLTKHETVLSLTAVINRKPTLYTSAPPTMRPEQPLKSEERVHM